MARIPPDPSAQRVAEATTAVFGGSGEKETVQIAVSASAAVARAKALHATPTRIGPYELFESLGEGGMGVVYRARRSDGLYSKDVALKRIRVHSEDLARRFLRERDILGALVHPGIASLLDGGTDADGVPYLVLEYVEGSSLAEWAKRTQPATRDILRLGIGILDALGYAHARLIVHCDLKPANVLIDGRNQPKIVDFGIARVLDGEQQQVTSHAFTPQYAAPEQLQGLPPTALSDLYSFAVMLYELLTGELPYRPERGDVIGWGQAILHDEPRAPSGKAEDGRRKRELSGELDAVLLKALEKDPERRYPNALAFAEDLQRYLDGYPVHAQVPSLRVKVGKYLHRNRLFVATGALVLAAMLIGSGIALYQSHIARQQRDAALLERRKSQAVGSFLERMLSYANPLVNVREHPGEMSMNEVLDESTRRLRSSEFDAQPAIKAELLRLVSENYAWQGRYDTANQLALEWIALVKARVPEDATLNLLADATAAAIAFGKQDFAAAEKGFRATIPALRAARLSGAVRTRDLAAMLNNYAYLRRSQGDSAQAEALFRETLALLPQMPAEDYFLVSTVRSTLASTLADQGRFDEALATAHQAVADFRTEQQRRMPDYGFALTVLGGFLLENGELDAAQAALSEAEKLLRARLRPDHLWLGDNLRNQGLLYLRRGDLAQALQAGQSARAIYDASFGERYDHYPTVLMIEAEVRSHESIPDQAEALFQRALKLRRENLPPEHYFTALAESAYGAFLAEHGRRDQARPLLEHAVQSLLRSQGVDSPRTRLAQERLKLLEPQGTP